MSRWAKVSWLLCGLSVLILVAVRFILGGWANFLYVPLAVLVVSFGLALALDWKFYLEFFTLRTTKHGMNMGVLIILVVALLAAVNMISVRFNKSFDLTSEKLNSLSDQSGKVIGDLKENLGIVVFYRGMQDQEPKAQMKELLAMYQDVSPKVQVRFVDAYREHLEAQKYLKDIKGEPGLVLFAEYQGRKIRAQQPLQEEQVTTAIIKATRTDKKKVYFLTGHGEKDFTQEQASHEQQQQGEDSGLTLLKQGLEDSSFQVETLNLIDRAEMPADAGILAILGPTSQILDREMDILRNFARKGGRFLVAADPGSNTNVAQLVKTFGIEFANNYLVNEFNFLAQRDAGEALGVLFDRDSDITKAFRSGNNFTAFPLASEVKKAPDASPTLKVKELVKTNEASYVVTDITKPNKPSSQRQPYTVAVSSEGRLSGSEPAPAADGDPKSQSAGDNFAAVVFGDSEFLTNGWIVQGINRDLVLNSVAYLAKEADLISVRPKKAEGTQLVMSPTTRVIVVLLGLLLPLGLLTSSGVVWFRRRGA